MEEKCYKVEWDTPIITEIIVKGSTTYSGAFGTDGSSPSPVS